MNTVNQMAHKSVDAFIASTVTMLDIFGEVEVKLAPAFGGETLEIKTIEDLDNLKQKFAA